MTTQKTFKHRVRARSVKTGESYTAARSQLLRKAGLPAAVAAPPDPMALTGMSDDAMRRGSGKTIGQWLEILDAWGATEHKHPEIARRLVAEHGIGGWWAQSVTVGYERARGMRAMHERPSGFEVSASKTISASAEQITDAFSDASLRERWLPDAPIRERLSTRGRARRFDWDDPPSRVVCELTSKGEAKTQIGLLHEKLPDADTAERMKAMWRGRLTQLKELLEGERP